MTLSSGSSSGCQRTPRTKSPSADSIASTLSSSVAQALASRFSGIVSTPWWWWLLTVSRSVPAALAARESGLDPHVVLGP